MGPGNHLQEKEVGVVVGQDHIPALPIYSLDASEIQYPDCSSLLDRSQQFSRYPDFRSAFAELGFSPGIVIEPYVTFQFSGRPSFFQYIRGNRQYLRPIFYVGIWFGWWGWTLEMYQVKYTDTGK